MSELDEKIDDSKKSLNFLEQIIEDDLSSGNYTEVLTRFPPEPNGYLHIGHAKSICLNFGLAQRYNGKCNLRFDDTNPDKESDEYVRSIQRDIQWLGFSWSGDIHYASDYFEQLYQWAVKMIKAGSAYVCDMTAEEISANRGTPQVAGNPSPWRNRSADENLNLFERMRAGEFEEGTKCLRAKIDMASPNMHMRDPVMYRIKKSHHHRTGDKWCIYPMYDYAHGQSDYIEGITHSVCTLEFEVHRPLYEWFLEQIADQGKLRPKQREFARLNINYTVMSKRYLLNLVESKIVSGWDDPRMPTVSGLRRRGYTPESIREFADRVGVARRENVIDVSLLEFCVREDLNRRAQRVMGVIDPIKLIVTNYPEGTVEQLEAVNNPEDASMGVRNVPFTRELFIEREDFMENPPKGYFRLFPGAEVRLRYAYFVTCTNVVKDSSGIITEIHCTYDPASRGGNSPDGRKVKGTIHWVSATEGVPAEVRLYDRLFVKEDPYDVPEGKDYLSNLNTDSLKVVNAVIEPFVANTKAGDSFQFERLGYFCTDTDSQASKLVFNRTVTLKDSWAKAKK